MNVKKAIFLALVAALVLKLFFFDFIIAQGQSMEPIINNGDVLIVSRMRYGIQLPWRQPIKGSKYLIWWAAPKVGEVVVFYTPSGELAVKRCAEIINDRSFFAKGDNGLASYDSRSYGPVPFQNIIGKVLGY